MAFLLFDIGGTKMRIAVADESGEAFADPKIIDTPQNFSEGIDLIVKLGRELAGERAISAVAGGVAGTLNAERTLLVNSPNLPGWVNHPLKAELEKRIGAPVFLENDTALVGLGEAAVGAGKGEEIVAYITVSTGVNGVRIVRGQIDETHFGFEIGHQIIVVEDSGGRASERRPEDLISGASLERRYGKWPSQIKDPQVWEEAARYLAYVANNAIVHWSPDIVVIGGSVVTGGFGIAIDRVREELRQILKVFPDLPRVEPASLKDVGGLYGALTFLKYKFRASK